jgi:hypothetical protein
MPEALLTRQLLTSGVGVATLMGKSSQRFCGRSVQPGRQIRYHCLRLSADDFFGVHPQENLILFKYSKQIPLMHNIIVYLFILFVHLLTQA